ncbi:MAG: hypothetical protein M3R57_11275 [Chloroflexota bacterium]|nr:hypothetical protein [Chloroflexota bacterium]
MRRPIAFLVSGLFALALLAAGSLSPVRPVSAATIAPTTTCNNDLGNGGAVCEVTVVNTITPTGGSAVVTVRECQGSAGVPDATCTNTTSPLSEPVTAVTQCNNSINGGGGTLLCSIVVTNNFVGISPSPTVTAATVNQCNGSSSGGGTTRVCDPDPATTSGATITQCNGSANGGGTDLTCTASGTQSSGLTVLINQCNGSSNGGGTRTVCSATMTNNILPAATPTPTPTPVPAPTATAAPTASPGAGPTATPRPTAPNTSTAQLVGGRSGTDLLVVSGLVFLGALSLITVVRRRTRST